MRGKTIAAALLLSALPLLAQSSDIYDHSQKRFRSSKGGVDEYILNKMVQSSLDIGYIEEIDKLERMNPFVSFDEPGKEWELGRECIPAVSFNQDLISHVSRKSPDELDNAAHRRLRYILDDMAEVRHLPELERIAEVHKIVMKRIVLGGRTFEPATLEQLLSGEPGDANDMVCAMYALLEHAGIFVSYSVGTLESGENHYWLNIKYGEHSFIYDPVYYQEVFVPIELRMGPPGRVPDVWKNA